MKKITKPYFVRHVGFPKGATCPITAKNRLTCDDAPHEKERNKLDLK